MRVEPGAGDDRSKAGFIGRAPLAVPTRSWCWTIDATDAMRLSRTLNQLRSGATRSGALQALVRRKADGDSLGVELGIWRGLGLP